MDDAPTGAVIPRATYRLQLHHAFTFAHAAELLPYLHRLGISHVYCSPITRARPGSMHGYDVVAPDQINPELGGAEGFERLAGAARAHGMGLLIDMVPNHMGIGADNAWWMHVLENGPASRYAHYFDIDWQPRDRALEGKVLLPVLGEPFGHVLEQGQLALALDAAGGAFELRYFEHRFPLDPRSVAPLLQRAARHAGSAGPALDEIASVFGRLPPRDAADARAARARDVPPLKARLAALVQAQPAARAGIDAALAEAQAPDDLEALHEAQAWRLAYWRVASDEINYRRFFDINELAALRIEEPEVFEATQGLALDLAAAGHVQGLRIDHPDGLHDPGQYFERLQHGYARRRGLTLPERDAQGRPPRPLYVVAEKIAAAHEGLPEHWALHGTTGYRFANVVNGVLVDGSARKRFDGLWRRFSGELRPFEALAWEGKHIIMRDALAAELTVLAQELLRIARAHRRTRDHTYNSLRRALAEVAACMPVYRTYIVEQPSEQDRRFVGWAVAQARRHSRAADTSIFDFVRETLLAQAVEGADDALRARVHRFALRFQQFTSPVSAKGVEDTAFYRYSRLLSLNEVGGDPAVFGLSVRGFHAANAARAARWPHTILATSTHDNKRSEDVRCRLDVLSELPALWRQWLGHFAQAPQLQRLRAEGPAGPGEAAAPLPSRADEYLLLQTLLGTLPAEGLDDDTLPAYRERIEAYMLKAVREAKLHSSWVSPNAEYEDGLLAFVRSVLARVRPNPLLTELQAQAALLAGFGALNSLSMVLLKLTAPGVPDLYQGNELMDLSLVDPDNRRPVDYAWRERLLGELQALHAAAGGGPVALAELAAAPHDGRLKLWLTWRLLQLRAAHEALFRDGGYRPLAAHGAGAAHVVAYQRDAGDERVCVIAGRLFARLLRGRPGWPVGADVWGDTAVALPPAAGLADGTRLRNVLTGEAVEVRGGAIALAQAFASLPAAALTPLR